MPTKYLHVPMGIYYIYNVTIYVIIYYIIMFQYVYMEQLQDQILSYEISFTYLQSSFVLGYVPQKVCFIWEEKTPAVKPWPCRHLWKEKESLSALIPPQNPWVTNGTGANRDGGTAKKKKKIETYKIQIRTKTMFMPMQ